MVSGTVVYEQAYFSVPLHHVAVPLHQPVCEESSCHPHLGVTNVLDRQVSPAETTWPLPFANDQRNSFVAPVHVDAKKHSQSLAGLLSPMALLVL